MADEVQSDISALPPEVAKRRLERWSKGLTLAALPALVACTTTKGSFCADPVGQNRCRQPIGR
jgi:hypothetical protein